MAQNVPPIQITVNFKNVRSYPKNVGQKMLIYAAIFFKRYWRTVAGRRLICKSIVGKISPKLREKLSRKLRMLIREIGSYYHCNCQSRADERNKIRLTGRWYGIKSKGVTSPKKVDWLTRMQNLNEQTPGARVWSFRSWWVSSLLFVNYCRRPACQSGVEEGQTSPSARNPGATRRVIYRSEPEVGVPTGNWSDLWQT